MNTDQQKFYHVSVAMMISISILALLYIFCCAGCTSAKHRVEKDVADAVINDIIDKEL